MVVCVTQSIIYNTRDVKILSYKHGKLSVCLNSHVSFRKITGLFVHILIRFMAVFHTIDTTTI